jgi:uncharacterized protein (TIGR03086 family)
VHQSTRHRHALLLAAGELVGTVVGAVGKAQRLQHLERAPARIARAEVLNAYRVPGVIENTGASLGIAFSDQLLHGWDLAKATAQDATMPEGLPEAAFEMIHGRFTDAQREGVFRPEVKVPANASAQDKLLAYTGRDPSG